MRHTTETHLIPIVLEVAAGEGDSVRVFGTDYPTPDGTAVRDYELLFDRRTAMPFGDAKESLSSPVQAVKDA